MVFVGSWNKTRVWRFTETEAFCSFAIGNTQEGSAVTNGLEWKERFWTRLVDCLVVETRVGLHYVGEHSAEQRGWKIKLHGSVETRVVCTDYWILLSFRW